MIFLCKLIGEPVNNVNKNHPTESLDQEDRTEDLPGKKTRPQPFPEDSHYKTIQSHRQSKSREL